MGRVNVDKDSLLIALKQLEQYESDIEAARAALNKKYQLLGSSWNDRKYQELGDIVSECNSALRTVQKSALLGEQSIAALIKVIQAYEDTNIRNSDSPSGNLSMASQAYEDNNADGEETSEGRPLTRHLSADEVNNLWMARVKDTDAMIENYREALLERGVPEGEWLNNTLADHRSRMLEQQGRILEVASGHAGSSDNVPNIYQYPRDYSAFYDGLANEYRSYCASDSGMVNSSDSLDASERIKNYGGSFISGLGEQEQNSIRQYTGVSYANINATLRGLESNFDEGNLEKTISIHSVLQRTELPCECTVYRGISSSALGELATLSDEQLVGQVYIDPGFLSTSLDSSDAFYNDVLLEIHAPAGSHGMYVGSISYVGNNEQEVLFDFNQNMRINSVRTDDSGRRVIDVTLI